MKQALWIILTCATPFVTFAQDPLFVRLSPDESGITFINALREGPGSNVLEYEYFYNGGGVGIGDLDGDGLPGAGSSARSAFCPTSRRTAVAWPRMTTMATVTSICWWAARVCRGAIQLPQEVYSWKTAAADSILIRNGMRSSSRRAS